MLNILNNGQLKVIFNNPQYYYEYRESLRGSTGRMSSLLLNYQFILYDYLIHRGIEINRQFDIPLLIYLLLIVDTLYSGDINYIADIITQLRHSEYNNIEFWQYLFNSINRQIDILNHAKYDTYTENYTTSEIIKKIEPFNNNDFLQWEYYPDYAKESSKLITDSSNIEHIKTICYFFTGSIIDYNFDTAYPKHR